MPRKQIFYFRTLFWARTQKMQRFNQFKWRKTQTQNELVNRHTKQFSSWKSTKKKTKNKKQKQKRSRTSSESAVEICVFAQFIFLLLSTYWHTNFLPLLTNYLGNWDRISTCIHRIKVLFFFIFVLFMYFFFCVFPPSSSSSFSNIFFVSI